MKMKLEYNAESVIFVETQHLNENNLKEAAELIQAGEIVAFPTDTVYGLGADATNNEAVNKIFQAKDRPSDRPISVLVANYKDLEKYAVDVSEDVFLLAEKFWPGPLTIILKNGGLFAPAVTPGIETVGLRMPDNQIALDFIQKCGTPLATPSANTSGRPSPTMAEHVLEDLDGKISAVIDGGETSFGIESTVLDFSDSDNPIILRPGNITKELIEETIQKKVQLKSEKIADLSTTKDTDKHYEPKIPVYIVESTWEQAIDQMNSRDERIAILANQEIVDLFQNETHTSFSLGAVDDVHSANRYFFQGLRTLEQSEATVILVEPYTKGELSLPYMNRLQFAADNKVI